MSRITRDPQLKSMEADPFFMTNLWPESTGLPMTIWVLERANAWHDCWVKVSMVHGKSVEWDKTAIVSVRPRPRVIVGELSPEDLTAVSEWIVLNKQVILDHWNYLIDSVELVRRLQRLP